MDKLEDVTDSYMAYPRLDISKMTPSDGYELTIGDLIKTGLGRILIPVDGPDSANLFAVYLADQDDEDFTSVIGEFATYAEAEAECVRLEQLGWSYMSWGDFLEPITSAIERAKSEKER